jgi:membrane protease YdiL (CAAX protease family)
MLQKIREFTERYAIVSSLLITLLFFLLLNGTALVFNLLPNSLFWGYAQELFIALYSVGLVILLGFKSVFNPKGFFKALLSSTVVIAVMLFSLWAFFDKATSNPAAEWASTRMIIFGLVQAVGIGIREECFFRGAIQSIIAKKYIRSAKGVWFAALIASSIFGIVHLFNLFTGFNPLVVFMQAISATGTGLFFAAVYLRSRSLWVPILVHALIDTVALSGSIFLTQTRAETVNELSLGALAGMAIYILPTIFLLRPSKCKQIYESLCFAEKESATDTQE